MNRAVLKPRREVVMRFSEYPHVGVHFLEDATTPSISLTASCVGNIPGGDSHELNLNGGCDFTEVSRNLDLFEPPRDSWRP